MSQENVDLVGRSIGAFNSGNWDELLEYMDEGIEWRAPFVVADQDTYVGRDGVRALLDSMDGQLRGLPSGGGRSDRRRGRCRGRGTHQSCQGIASGAGVRSNPFAHVVGLRDGKILRWAMYDSAQEALEAVRLRE